MRNLKPVGWAKKALIAVAALVSVLVFAHPPVEASDWAWLRVLLEGEVDGAAIATDDTDVAMLVKYVGNEGSGLVAVDAATGDLTFTDGAEGGEAATDTFECPVSGGLGGVIDVSNAACNTLGEVCDAINGQSSGATGWRCVILDGLRSDSSNNSLLTISATAATAEAGLGLAWDTDTVGFNVSRCMNCSRDISTYLAGVGTNPKLVPNPFAGTRTFFLTGRATSTYGSGTSTFQIISSLVNNNLNNTEYGAETNTTIWSIAGGATTAEAIFNQFEPYGLPCKKSEKCLARLSNSAAMASVNFNVTSTRYSYPK